jgi:hypothetical protein
MKSTIIMMEKINTGFALNAKALIIHLELSIIEVNY